MKAVTLNYTANGSAIRCNVSKVYPCPTITWKVNDVPVRPKTEPRTVLLKNGKYNGESYLKSFGSNDTVTCTVSAGTSSLMGYIKVPITGIKVALSVYHCIRTMTLLLVVFMCATAIADDIYESTNKIAFIPIAYSYGPNVTSYEWWHNDTVRIMRQSDNGTRLIVYPIKEMVVFSEATYIMIFYAKPKYNGRYSNVVYYDNGTNATTVVHRLIILGNIPFCDTYGSEYCYDTWLTICILQIL